MYNFVSSVGHKKRRFAELPCCSFPGYSKKHHKGFPCFYGASCPFALGHWFTILLCGIVQHDHLQNILVWNLLFEWTIPLIARLIRLTLIWTLLSPHCTEHYTEQPSDQTARSLRQKRQFPRREFILRWERGTQGGRERRSESKGWKSVVESKRWLLPEVICLFAALSTDVGAPFFQ